MGIIITDNRKIGDIQTDFRACYPYLKIEFYFLPESKGNDYLIKKSIPPETTIGAVRQIHYYSEKIFIDNFLTVGNLEKKFHVVYGISIRICRKSGKEWLPCTTTKNWTLFEQNIQGKLMCEELLK